MAVLREILAKFGVQFDSRQLQKGQASIAGTIGQLRNLGGALAASYVVRGVANFVNEIRDAGDELDKSSKQIGLTVQQLQELRHAANLSGVDAAGFTQSLRLMQKNMDMAAQGNKTMTELFDRLGISIQGADGQLRTLDNIMPDLADAFMNMENPAERVAIAYQVMGRQGARMLPMFEKGAAGLAEMRAEAEKLGGGMGEDAVDASVKLTDNLARLDFAMLGVKSSLAVVLLPMLDVATRALTTFSGLVKRGVENTNMLQAIMIGLGGFGARALWQLLGGFKGILRILRPLIFRLALPILLIDDLITLFKGGKSVIGAAIDAIFGKGSTEKVRTWFKEAWDGWKDVIQDFRRRPDEFRANLRGALDSIADDIRNTFGDAFGGAAESLAFYADIMQEDWFSLGQFIKDVGAVIEAHFAASMAQLGAQSDAVVTQIRNAFAGLWDSIVGGAADTIGSLAGALKDVPGVGDTLTKAKGALDALRVGQKAIAGFSYGEAFAGAMPADARRRLLQYGQFAQRGGPQSRESGLPSTQLQAVNPRASRTVSSRGQPAVTSTTSVVVNVPPGTPPQQARSVGNAAAKGAAQGMRKTQRALAHTGG